MPASHVPHAAAVPGAGSARHLRSVPLQRLTDQGTQKVHELAKRYGVSADAVMALLQALVNGHGAMAQFNHAELGGNGQWMRGGMTMVGDMFNNSLRAKIDGLCSELSQLLAQQPFMPAPAGFQSQMQGGGQQQQQGGSGFTGPDVGSVSLFVPDAPGRGSGQWWPVELGMPNGSGAQNHIRYAYFNHAHRLAVEMNGRVTVYDTLNHHIGGVSQQQGAGGSLILTSQFGTVSVASLPVLSVDGVPRTTPPPSGASATATAPAEPVRASEVFETIERLADLQKKGVLSAEEFATKKTELLSRL
jgi:hypothetical protein